MVRYHLSCKNSLLLLKRKFLLRVGEKLVFLIEFMFLFYFVFIYLHCYISTSSLNGVTLWKLIFPFLVPHWILVVSFVSTVISSWFFPFWTLLYGVYRPYGLKKIANFDRSVTAICLATPILQCTSELQTGHQRLCHVRLLCCTWWGF